MAERLYGFERHYEEIASPFEWTSTRRDLRRLLHELEKRVPTPAKAA